MYGYNSYDPNTVSVLFFEYKTYNTQVFKIKQTDNGLEKALEKPDTFNPELLMIILKEFPEK